MVYVIKNIKNRIYNANYLKIQLTLYYKFDTETSLKDDSKLH